MRRLVIGVVLVAALGATLVACSDASSDTTMGDRNGMAQGYELPYMTPTVLDRYLDGVAATGVRYLRVEFSWAGVEGDQGHIVWTRLDRVVDHAVDRGLDVLALLAYTPEWARPKGEDEKAPPVDLHNFAHFASEAAKHFGDRVRRWEIWNEPNVDQFWAPKPDPERYARLFALSAKAIRDVQRDAIVITGGLAPSDDTETDLSPTTFLRRAYDSGVDMPMDAVGWHPYTFPESPTEPSGNLLGVTTQLHDIMRAHGDGDLPIWGTEMGAPTSGSRTPEDYQRYMIQAYAGWETLDFTGPLFWFEYRDVPSDGPFGLVHRNFSPKPSLDEFITLMHTR